MHETWNFVVPAKKRECFFEEIDSDLQRQKVDVFIHSGGNLDITLTIHGPLKLKEIYSGKFEDPEYKDYIDTYKETDSDSQTFSTDFKPKAAGIYAFCLDNRSSRFLSKNVQLDITPMKPLDDPIKVKLVDEQHAGDVDIHQLKESLHSLNAVSKGISLIQLQQQRDRHRLSLHSDTNALNYDKVFFGSIIETFIFILVSIFQIFFVRRWFASKVPARAKNWA